MRANRKWDELRPIHIQRAFLNNATLVSYGNTKVLCSASFEAAVPRFLRDQGTGWLSAEYAMLPSATQPRGRRESKSGKQTGRTQEIQRLIGRSLRAALNLEALGERSIIIDADVIQADGGTRTAAITGGMVALYDLIQANKSLFTTDPIRHWIGAVSIGLHQTKLLLDLQYDEDVIADVDMTVVMTESGSFIELQGTAEHYPFSRTQLDKLLETASSGIQDIIQTARAGVQA